MRRRRALRFLALDFGFYTPVAALFATQKVAVYAARGEAVGLNGLLLSFFGVYTWAALTPLVFWLSRRFPVGRRGRPRNLLAHVFLGIAVVAVDILVYAFLDHYAFPFLGWGDAPPSLAGKFLALFIWGAAGDLLWYGSVVAVAHALAYREMFREGDVRATALQGRLTATRLQVLKTQLQPHFLFNTLHTISTLLHEDPGGAKRMIARLSHLLKLTLESDAEQEVPLREELEVVESYLAIQLMRFDDRLAVHRDVDPAALDARVPNLILQPLVENAVRHGIAPRAAKGRIEIRASRRDGWLDLEVRDNGKGLPADPGAVREGVGLANTRARLHQLYGTEGRLCLANAPGGGLSVAVEIPFRTGAVRGRDRGREPAADARLSLPRGRSFAAVAFGAWILFGLLLAGQSLLLTAADRSVLDADRFWLIGYQSLAWSLFSVLIFRLCERFPLGRAGRRRNVAVHAAANLLLFSAGTLLLVGVDELTGWVIWFDPVPVTVGDKVVRAAIMGCLDYLIRYWLVVGVAHAISYGQLFREREWRASDLEARLAAAELQLLRMQLHPSFLFETLHAIVARVGEDPRSADKMLTRLSDILRIVLDHEGKDEVSLERELSFLDPYLELQQSRFGARLVVDVDIEPQVLGASVPNLLLQSLVETILPRRLEAAAGHASVRIRAWRAGARLALEVRSDGGHSTRGALSSAADLEASRARLRQMYGDEHVFAFEDSRGGVCVRVEIPYREEPDVAEGGPSAAEGEPGTPEGEPGGAGEPGSAESGAGIARERAPGADSRVGATVI